MRGLNRPSLQPHSTADTAPNAAALLGDGYLAFTVDQGPDRERHQGIVSIEGEWIGGYGAALLPHE